MNLLAHVAILVGRRKFEDFAKAHPELPDDALAVANTLDAYSTRGAATMIAGSFAHAGDNLLKGTETIDLVAVHLLIILCGVCIVWVRHAISQHDVRVNATVQQARAATGIAKVLLVALLVAAPLTGAAAQTTISNLHSPISAFA